jgi:NAD(P)-dependent dehydrogenase (short-subunit alcohol dehydrogenase family)
MPVALITGANRGIGLEHARQYADQGWEVHACARAPEVAQELLAVKQRYSGAIHLHPLDVTDHSAVSRLADNLNKVAIDVLLNNAGTFGPQGAPEGMAYQSLQNMDFAVWREILEVNLLGAFKVATAFRDHVAGSAMRLMVNMSSGLASIEDNQGSSYAYRTSKAGLNMLTTGMASEWSDITVISMAPGWCKTDLGGADAPVEAVDSVRDQQALFPRLTIADSGRFVDVCGDNVPW